MKSYDWENQAGVTQRLSTLKRTGKSNYTSPTQEEYINQVAKTRLLEDELLAEKIKCEALQRKGYQYIDTIAQLEYAIGDMKLMLQKADRQLERHLQTDHQIEAYSSNLRQVGRQLASLNQILQKKNKQCNKLVQANAKLKQQALQLQNKIRLGQSRKQQQKNKLRDILESLGTEAEPSFSDQLLRDMEVIQERVNELKESLSKTKSALDKHRKQTSDSLIKERERIISLQFSLKLAEKRNQDLEKKKNLQSSFTIDKKVEDMIQQMLKKQEDLNARISQLEFENQELKEQLEFEKQSNSHFVELKQKDHSKQIKEAKETIKQLIHDKNEISQKFDELCHSQEIQGSRLVNEELELSKKYREFCQENKRLKLKISELESDKKMLEKQLNLRNSN